MWLESTQEKTPFRFALAMSRPHAAVARAAAVFVFIASSLDAVVPYIFKSIVDAATAASPDARALWFWAGAYLSVTFLDLALWRLSGFVGAKWVSGARATAQYALSSYVTRHSYAYFSNRFAGALVNKIGNAANGARSLIEDTLWGHLPFLLSISIGFALVYNTSTVIGAIFTLWLLLVIPINVVLSKKKIPLGTEAQRRETEIRANTVDVFTNITAVYDFARRKHELERFKDLIDIRRLASIRNWRFSEIILSVNNVIEMLFVGAIVLVSVFLWTRALITSGDIVLVLTLLLSIRGELTYIGHRFNSFAESYSEVREGLEEVLRKHEVTDVPYATKLTVDEGAIRFMDVTFSYLAEPVLLGLSLAVESGEKVGIVGKSGAGKSTLAKLLLRQYELTSGHILIDGQDIGLVTQESLRDQIAIIPQEPLLFHRSVRENVRYGNLGATERDVVEAAKLAQAHEFIQKLPEGYDTLVGERGVKLSGGQRQRVAIARALLKRARVLVLDEATSSLDSESEAAIQQALLALMRDKTVIAIAHRLSTLRAMDRIVVLDQGRIVEDGTHQELTKLGGIYAELWQHQAGGFLQDT